jgi:hypothetical protein
LAAANEIHYFLKEQDEGLVRTSAPWIGPLRKRERIYIQLDISVDIDVDEVEFRLRSAEPE